MLTIRDLKKSHGGRVLFEGASLQVNYGERVALVGPNGSGKSTLFSLILKKDEPDEGTVQRDEWTMLGYLPQEGEAVGGETALDIATGKAGEIQRLPDHHSDATYSWKLSSNRLHFLGINHRYRKDWNFGFENHTRDSSSPPE